MDSKTHVAVNYSNLFVKLILLLVIKRQSNCFVSSSDYIKYHTMQNCYVLLKLINHFRKFESQVACGLR